MATVALSGIITPSNVVTATSTATLTNKTISGASNTLTNIPLSTGVTGTLPVANLPSGSVIQVANLASQSVFSTTDTTIQQGPQTSTFTLLSNSSKVMVIANFALYGVAGSSGLVYIYSSIYRGSIASGTRLNSTLVIDSKGSMTGQYVGSGGEMYQYVTLTYLDTPTASTTYSIGYTKHAGTGQSNAYIQGCNITLMEISV